MQMPREIAEDAQPTRDRTKRLGRQSALFVLVALSTTSTALIVVFVIYLSRLLRPIADDYSIGSVAVNGVWWGVGHFWNTWSGDLFSRTIMVLFSGWPLVNLPWSFSSAVAFLAATTVMVAIVVWLVFTSRRHSHSLPTWIILTSLAGVAATCWWVYWWAPPTFSPLDEQDALLAASITLWQTINTQYVMSIGILTWLVLLLQRHQKRLSIAVVPAWIFIGLLIGLTGPVFAAAALAAIGLGIAIVPVCQLRIRIGQIALWGLAAFGVAVGAGISHLSPGTRYRSTFFESPSVDPELARRLIADLPGVLDRWWGLVLNPGTMLTFVLVAFTTMTLGLLGTEIAARRLLWIGASLIIFSWLMALAHHVSTAFVSFGPWHLVQVGAFVWLGIAILGATAGFSLARLGRRNLMLPVMLVAYITALGLTAASIGTMAGVITNRHGTWVSGPAPQSGIFDIEVEFLRPAWLVLRDVQGGPDRSLESPR